MERNGTEWNGMGWDLEVEVEVELQWNVMKFNVYKVMQCM